MGCTLLFESKIDEFIGFCNVDILPKQVMQHVGSECDKNATYQKCDTDLKKATLNFRYIGRTVNLRQNEDENKSGRSDGL